MFINPAVLACRAHSSSATPTPACSWRSVRVPSCPQSLSCLQSHWVGQNSESASLRRHDGSDPDSARVDYRSGVPVRILRTHGRSVTRPGSRAVHAPRVQLPSIASHQRWLGPEFYGRVAGDGCGVDARRGRVDARRGPRPGTAATEDDGNVCGQVYRLLCTQAFLPAERLGPNFQNTEIDWYSWCYAIS